MKARSDAERAEAEARKARAAEARASKRFFAGDAVVFNSGPMAGQSAEVAEIRHGRAFLRLSLFGTDRAVEVDAAVIEKVDGSDDDE